MTLSRLQIVYGYFFFLVRTFPETMSSGDDHQQGPQFKHQHLIRSPSYLTLTLRRFALGTAPSEVRTLVRT